MIRVAHVNYFFDRDIREPGELLDRYRTLTGVCEGSAESGCEVTVIQRFHTAGIVNRNGVTYRFIREPVFKPGSVIDRAERTNAAALAFRPEIFHIHGLGFARQAARLKRMTPKTPILVQDHLDSVPSRLINRLTVKRAFESIDAVAFVAVEQARPWADSGILGARTTVCELMEGSSRFEMRDRQQARWESGLTGDPLCLWVGRLNPTKDPLTVLEGFALASRALPSSRLEMIYTEAPLLPQVREWLATHPEVANRVNLRGPTAHAELEAIYNSADVFLLGSRREGSGFALLEALSCGIQPAVTAIPPFRILTGEGSIGMLWEQGSARSCADAIIRASRKASPAEREMVRIHFQQNFSYGAIGRAAHAVYLELCGSRHGAGNGIAYI